MADKASLNPIVNIDGKDYVFMQADDIQTDSNHKVYDLNLVKPQNNVLPTEQVQKLHHLPITQTRTNYVQSQLWYHTQADRQQNPSAIQIHPQLAQQVVDNRLITKEMNTDHKILEKKASDCVKQCQYKKDSMIKINTFHKTLAKMAADHAKQCQYNKKLMKEISIYHETLANIANAHVTQCHYNKDSMKQINNYHKNFANAAVVYANQCQRNIDSMKQINAYHLILVKTSAYHAIQCKYNKNLMEKINVYHKTVDGAKLAGDSTKQCQHNNELIEKINAYHITLSKMVTDDGKQCRYNKESMKQVDRYHKTLVKIVADHANQYKYKENEKQTSHIREENLRLKVRQFVHGSSEIQQFLPDNQNHSMTESANNLQLKKNEDFDHSMAESATNLQLKKNEDFDESKNACILRFNGESKTNDTQLLVEDKVSRNSKTEQVFVVKCNKEDKQKTSKISVIDLTICDNKNEKEIIQKQSLDVNTDELNNDVKLKFEEDIEVKEEIDDEIAILKNDSPLNKDNYIYPRDEGKDDSLIIPNESKWMQFDEAKNNSTYQKIERTKNNISIPTTKPIPEVNDKFLQKHKFDVLSMCAEIKTSLQPEARNEINDHTKLNFNKKTKPFELKPRIKTPPIEADIKYQHKIGKKRKVAKVENIVNNVPKLSEQSHSSMFLRLGGDVITSKRLRRTSVSKDVTIKRIDSSESNVISPPESPIFTLPNNNGDKDTNENGDKDINENGDFNRNFFSIYDSFFSTTM